MIRRTSAFLGIAACVLTAGCSVDSGAAESGEYRGTRMPEPIEKVDFTLTDTEGESFDFRRETDGYLTLLFFGYTHCPDVCPVHMGNIAAVLEKLPSAMRRQIKVVFVTTDPERDTQQRLREWLDNFDPEFIGLRGPKERVDEIQSEFGLPPAVKQHADGGGGDYTVGHSARVLAFTPDNLAHVSYPFGTRQTDLAQDLPKLLTEDWQDRG